MNIEISGVCQAKCQYCMQYRLKKDKNFGCYMSPDLFERILVHLFDIGILDRHHSHKMTLYNWGEPFLNNNINEILHILRKHNQFANLSSNFIYVPEIDRNSLSIIKNLVFSLSGMTQDAYGRIHGHNIKEVLDNFNMFYALLREHSPDTRIDISWHRYQFNEHELWDAFKFFKRPGITFRPVTAFFNDGREMLDYVKGNLAEERLAAAKKDLFLDDISKSVAYHRERSIGYKCPAWDSLTISEAGDLLLCCAYSRYDSHKFGNILELSADEVWRRKKSDPVCDQCISVGLARYYHLQSFETPTEKPLPPGGGLDNLLLHYNRLRIKRKWKSARQAIKTAVQKSVKRAIQSKVQ